jgi:hypothetical protein
VTPDWRAGGNTIWHERLHMTKCVRSCTVQYSSNSIMTSPATIPNINHVLSPGSSSFIHLAKSRKFVDKTYAIAEFLKDDGQPVHLVLRPRRSGKTILLRLFR